MGEMIKVKSAELIGPALDWAVAQAFGEQVELYCGCVCLVSARDEHGENPVYAPSTESSYGEPLIGLIGALVNFGGEWHAFLKDGKAVRSGGFGASYLDVDSGNGDADGVGETHMVAVCRAFVVGGLGEEVDIPVELATPAQ